MKRILLQQILTLLVMALHAQGFAAATILRAIDFTSLPADGLRLRLQFEGSVPELRSFSTENPPRIVLDLWNAGNGLEHKAMPVHRAGVKTIQVVDAGGRTRVVLNLSVPRSFQTRIAGNSLYVTLTSREAAAAEPATFSSGIPVEERLLPSGPRIEDIDFRRGEKGEGRVLVFLSDPRSQVDIRQEGRTVILDLPATELPPRLMRKLDVLDFATPVKTVEARPWGRGSRLLITPAGEEYDYSSYQSGKQLTVELRPLTRAEKEEGRKKKFAYGGDRLTLNFQDIPVRTVLQILADFTGLNIVASDSVQGNVTLRLHEVPWDQALDLVLKSKGLGSRKEGNIIRVAPLEEISRQEREELEALKIVEDLEPLRTEIIQINYTTADEIKKVLLGVTEKAVESISRPEALTGGRTTVTSETFEVSQSILSSRGTVTTDPRTNQLIVQDTSRNLERIRELVRQLDKPVRQVLIESRVVIANIDFSRELGAKLQFRPRTPYLLPSKGAAVPVPSVVNPTLANLGVDLATASPFGVAQYVITIGDYLLDLELSAAQKEQRAEIVANPRVVTADQTKATIEQGRELPYQITQQGTGGGFPVQNVAFKPVVLKLEVTPHITPDDNILMELKIKKDDQGELTPNGNFAIDKREINTTALVTDGETVVLGGVYEGTKRNVTDKIPFFGDLPGIGFMFRRNTVEDKKRELLIFITPKILKQTAMNP